MSLLPEIPGEATASPERLTQSVLQIADLLGLSRAELPRLLHLQCSDTAQLAAVRQTLIPGTPAWEQGLWLVRFYQALHQRMQGSEVARYRWLRTSSRQLRDTPLMLLVDHHQLVQVTIFLTYDTAESQPWLRPRSSQRRRSGLDRATGAPLRPSDRPQAGSDPRESADAPRPQVAMRHVRG
jgi:hypothetical protein